MNVYYTACPVCRSANILPLLKVKDYTVSGQQFDIWQCNECTVRFTQDAPDETSIGPFYKADDYISHTNTGKGAINQLYKKVRTITLKQKASLIKKATGKPNGKLLDIGCGTGAFLHTMKADGWSVTGIEPDDTARTVAKSVYGIDPLSPDQLFTQQRSSFDAITMWHVLEHVHSLHEYVAHLKTLLAPHGKLFVAVPNYNALDADVYGHAWAAYDVPRHLYHFTPLAIGRLMELHGLRVVDQKPMWFDAFYIAMLSSRNRWGKINWINATINGMRSNLNALANNQKCSSLIYVIEPA